MSPPLVSVLATTFNHEDFIEEAVHSLLNQTFAGDVEIIVVDDGSQDATWARLSAIDDPRLHPIRQHNQGPSAAVNHAIAAARGQILVLQSGDDVCEPDRLKSHVEVLQQAGYPISASHPQLIDEAGRPLKDELWADAFVHAGGIAAGRMLELLFYGRNFLCAPSVAFTRQVIERVGLFRTCLLQTQDYDYWLRCAALGLDTHINPERLVRYRLHAANLSRPANRSRVDFEIRAVLRRCLAHARPEPVRAVFEALLGQAPADVPYEALVPFLYLAHGRSEVREIGLQALIDAVEQNPELMARAFDLTPPRLFATVAQMMADH